MFDIWNEDEPLVKRQYEKDNYSIMDYDAPDAAAVCVVYFSSNGLYYPNTAESFERFVQADRYEWRHYHFRKVRREIYVRDIYKQWYVAGINERISSVSELADWLRNQVPKDCELFTVGNSAGGYMAVLMGSLLGAARVYTFSGQFSVEDALEETDMSRNTLFRRYARRETVRRYLNAVPYVQNAKNTHIYYFYPGRCPEDIRQAEMVRECENVHFFAFRDDKHGRTMYNCNLEDIFAMEETALLRLEKRLRGRQTGRLRFSLYTVGLWRTVKYLFAKWMKKSAKRRTKQPG